MFYRNVSGFLQDTQNLFCHVYPAVLQISRPGKHQLRLEASILVDKRRYAPTGRYRTPYTEQSARGLSQVYSGRGRRTYNDVYDRDHSGGKGRWLISTCVAAAVSTVIIAIVIVGSLDSQPSFNSVIDHISDAQRPDETAVQQRNFLGGLNWAMPKSGKLQIASGALSARYTIHEQVNVQRNNRPFIEIRSYMRIVARLAPATSRNAERIPRFNPLTLYATKADDTDGNSNKNENNELGKVDIRVVNLLPGIYPNQETVQLNTSDVTAIVQRAQIASDLRQEASLDQTGRLPAGLTPAYLSSDGFGPSPLDQIDPNVTILRRKITEDVEDDEDTQPGEVRVVRVGKGDTVTRILQRMRAPTWLAGNMINAANTVMAMNRISPGQEIHVRMVESVTQPGLLEPAGFTVFGPGHDHLVTVKRDAGGEFKASAKIDRDTLLQSLKSGANPGNLNSLYSAIYDAGLMQKLDDALILKILRTHAYSIDYRRRLRNGDQVELFFEFRKQEDGSTELGELFYTSIMTGGEASQFWRFRSRDGIVDYYDERGHNSKKFLMRKPVRGSAIRLTSGFGFRNHPVLQQRRMHTGVDWAGPRGTPILAAGKGIIEEARRRGTYGNYVRIKHANGYDTTYSHMHKFGPGIRKGVKVKQGQIIGYIGSTGLSSGPHLHYEVLVNKRFVDPLKIKVPRERRLSGEDLAAFQRERSRITDLLKRPPVETDTN